MTNQFQVTSKATMKFLRFFSVHQLIQVPKRITCNSATIIDHILVSYSVRVTQQSIVAVGLSDHQHGFCTGKSSRTTRGTHKH